MLLAFQAFLECKCCGAFNQALTVPWLQSRRHSGQSLLRCYPLSYRRPSDAKLFSIQNQDVPTPAPKNSLSKLNSNNSTISVKCFLSNLSKGYAQWLFGDVLNERWSTERAALIKRLARAWEQEARAWPDGLMAWPSEGVKTHRFLTVFQAGHLKIRVKEPQISNCLRFSMFHP